MTKPSSDFNPFEQYEVNEDLEKTGVWLVDPFHRMKVARAGGRNEAYQRQYDALTKPYKRAIQLKTLPKETDLALSRELYARACIKSWSVAELVKKDGKTVAKTDENGNTVWIDGKMFHPETFEVVDMSVEMIVRTFEVKPELYSYVVERANDVTTYRDEDADEEDVKNS